MYNYEIRQSKNFLFEKWLLFFMGIVEHRGNQSMLFRKYNCDYVLKFISVALSTIPVIK